MKMIEYLYAGFLITSIALIYFALKQYNKSSYLLSDGVKTRGKVVDLIRKSSDDGYTYTPVFEYKDRLNNIVTFNSSVSSKPASYKIGESVKIVYSKTDNEDRKIVSFWGLYRWTIILLCVAAPFLIIGGGYFLYARS